MCQVPNSPNQVTPHATEGGLEGVYQETNVPEVGVPVDPPEITMGTPGTHCSTCNPQPTVQYQEYVESLQANMLINQAAGYLPDLECHLTMKKGNPEMMRWHTAMQETDQLEFIKMTEAEVKAHTENGLWEIIPRY